MSNKPKPGDTLYHCRSSSELDEYKFLEESTYLGATLSTWAIKARGDNAAIIRCSVGRYHTTKRAAYEAYLQEAREAMPGAEQTAREAAEHVRFIQGEINIMEELITQDNT